MKQIGSNPFKHSCFSCIFRGYICFKICDLLRSENTDYILPLHPMAYLVVEIIVSCDFHSLDFYSCYLHSCGFLSFNFHSWDFHSCGFLSFNFHSWDFHSCGFLSFNFHSCDFHSSDFIFLNFILVILIIQLSFLLSSFL